MVKIISKKRNEEVTLFDLLEIYKTLESYEVPLFDMVYEDMIDNTTLAKTIYDDLHCDIHCKITIELDSTITLWYTNFHTYKLVNAIKS